ncbi:uncharacterized protein BDR25DRAFT_387455 [Lindgomyces ingoldianus]|uniref:Uncharacterized protein n=1 Tax=Lindgomyces ingoldianus TaxID=673940 RepID=A0ACB6R4D7_9PLEO|nr:uncharacterized protein BDR25DRAFT_387455 [Lindgomyces ingoldianus]KAF2473301.1 hypothetical protein BDR25DRAFT_387455 [Lindgomyces ingoldianus]
MLKECVYLQTASSYFLLLHFFTPPLQLAIMDTINTRCFISGFRGDFAITTALAYYYRGHYIYGPTGNPIEPQQFTNGRINVAGVTATAAPSYDPHSPRLRSENEVAALWKSKINEETGNFSQYIITEEDVEMRPTIRHAAQAALASGSVLASSSRVPTSHDHTVRFANTLIPQITTRPSSIDTRRAPQELIARTATSPRLFVPHDYAHANLHAASAPASHHTSPFVSTNSSPALTRVNLRNINSSSRLTKLIADVHPDVDLRAFPFIPRSDEPFWVDHLTAPTAPVIKCAIHGGDCDGLTTTESNTTERYLLGSGFREDVPMFVRGGDRVMVDWSRVKDQEMENLDRGRERSMEIEGVK